MRSFYAGSFRQHRDVMFFELLLAILAVLLSRTMWRRWRYDLHKIPSPPSWPWLGKMKEIADCHNQNADQHSLRALWLQQAGNPQIMRVRIRPPSNGAQMADSRWSFQARH